MSSPQPWFGRTFAFDMSTALLPNVLERLRGTPARLEERVKSLPHGILVARQGDKWSIQENVGHLCDLEVLWIKRAQQVVDGETELAVADLTNRGTDEKNHNAARLEDILKAFRGLRMQLVSVLEKAEPSTWDRSARHPRLGTPMRLIDIAFFTAEHDDHHLARISTLLQLGTRGQFPS